jgi:hypothetical protein
VNVRSQNPQPIQRAVEILNRLALAVGVLRQVVVGVVLLSFAQRRWEIRLRDAAKGTEGERGHVAVGVGDAGEFPSPTIKRPAPFTKIVKDAPPDQLRPVSLGQCGLCESRSTWNLSTGDLHL